MTRCRGAVLAVVTAAVMLVGPAATGAAKAQKPKLNPVIFVHGFVGSGAQFES
jgi:hypothetical protein